MSLLTDSHFVAVIYVIKKLSTLGNYTLTVVQKRHSVSFCCSFYKVNVNRFQCRTTPWSKNVHIFCFTVVSTNVGRFLQYIGIQYAEEICNVINIHLSTSFTYSCHCSLGKSIVTLTTKVTHYRCTNEKLSSFF